MHKDKIIIMNGLNNLAMLIAERLLHCKEEAS